MYGTIIQGMMGYIWHHHSRYDGLYMAPSFKIWWAIYGIIIL